MKAVLKRVAELVCLFLLQLIASMIAGTFFLGTGWSFAKFITDPFILTFWGIILLVEAGVIAYKCWRKRKKEEPKE